MSFPNPLTIQQQPNSSSVPLVFIHDGGGTAFNYFLLGDLGRDFYGIYNPRFEDGSSWSGGIPEMAATYLNMIGDRLPGRDIILGGWSLGGLVALEIFHQLAESPAFNVIGIVMLDSSFPAARELQDFEVDENDVGFDEGTRPHMREKITNCLREARGMIRVWDLPIWPKDHTAKQDKPEDTGTMIENIGLQTHQATQNLPPVVLLRAIDHVPSRKGRPSLPFLGWEQCGQRIVSEVYEIPGHHFSIFKSQNIGSCTRALRDACDGVQKGNVAGEVGKELGIPRISKYLT